MTRAHTKNYNRRYQALVIIKKLGGLQRLKRLANFSESGSRLEIRPRGNYQSSDVEVNHKIAI